MTTNSMEVHVYRICAGGEGYAKVTVFKESLDPEDDAVFENGMILWYKEFNRYKLYKAYALQRGEFVELTRK